MKISTNTRYALRFLSRVAERVPERITTSAVSELEGISEKMLERIAAKLAREGFVRSVKGMGGGFELLRPADEITVTQVLTVMETPYLPHHCVEDPEHCCKMSENCHMLSLWVRIDEAVRAVTDSVTVQDLIRPCSGKEGAPV